MSSDKTQINEFKQNVENDLAEFIGHEFCAARLIGFIEAARATGFAEPDKAKQLMADAYHLHTLATLGRKYAGWARRPPAELEMMLLEAHR